jgi:tetratricopeptide (TPR) repeat protein
MQVHKHTRLLFASGLKAFAEDDYLTCEALFTEMIEADPHLITGWEYRGAVRLRRGKTAEAIFDFSRAIILNPERARVYHLRGLAYERQGELDRAITDFNQAILLDRGYDAAYQSRTILRNRRSGEDAPGADLEAYRKLTELRIEESASASGFIPQTLGERQWELFSMD